VSEAQAQMNVAIPASLKARLQHAAVDTRRSMSDLVAQGIQELLDRLGH
jgi:predicted transcriptional regulator